MTEYPSLAIERRERLVSSTRSHRITMSLVEENKGMLMPAVIRGPHRFCRERAIGPLSYVQRELRQFNVPIAVSSLRLSVFSLERSNASPSILW